jgi:cell division ATPase FtsA
MPVRIGRPRDVVDPQSLVSSPVYATAVGLVVYAAQRMPARRRVKEPHSLVAAAFRLLSGWLTRIRK